MPELLAFTVEHACRLTGLSKRQLAYWDRTGFFAPTAVRGPSGRPFTRIYSFRDIVGLRTLALLRSSVPLQELRKVGEWLAARYESPWSALVFYLAGRRVYFEGPELQAIRAPDSGGQTVIPIEMKKIARETAQAAERLRERTSGDFGKINKSRLIAHNVPVVQGTRVPAEAVWNLHQGGYKTDDIIREYPRLTPADIKAAIEFEENRRSARAS